MKYLCHVPSEQYGFISVEVEGGPEDAVGAYFELSRAIKGGDGLGMREFAKVVHEYCLTGGIVNGGDKEFSVNEKSLLSALTKLLRK